jgi:hypothetical protein
MCFLIYAVSKWLLDSKIIMNFKNLRFYVCQDLWRDGCIQRHKTCAHGHMQVQGLHHLRSSPGSGEGPTVIFIKKRFFQTTENPFKSNLQRLLVVWKQTWFSCILVSSLRRSAYISKRLCTPGCSLLVDFTVGPHPFSWRVMSRNPVCSSKPRSCKVAVEGLAHTVNLNGFSKALKELALHGLEWWVTTEARHSTCILGRGQHTNQCQGLVHMFWAWLPGVHIICVETSFLAPNSFLPKIECGDQCW